MTFLVGFVCVTFSVGLAAVAVARHCLRGRGIAESKTHNSGKDTGISLLLLVMSLNMFASSSNGSKSNSSSAKPLFRV